MRQQRLLRISYSDRDAREALKSMIPSMKSGFNVNAVHGDFSVDGADAKALADLLVERIASRLEDAKARKTRQSARTNACSQSKP